MGFLIWAVERLIDATLTTRILFRALNLHFDNPVDDPASS